MKYTVLVKYWEWVGGEHWAFDPVKQLNSKIVKVEDYDANFGSGMPYVLGLLERQYKEGINIDEGIELTKESLKSSTQRDVGSGYGIDIFTVSKLLGHREIRTTQIYAKLIDKKKDEAIDKLPKI